MRHTLVDGAVRGACGAIGAFLVLNVLAGWLRPGLNGAEWLLDTRALAAIGNVLLLGCGIILTVAAARRGGPLCRKATIAALTLLIAIALANTISFYVLLARGRIAAAVPIPLSLIVCLLLLALLAGALMRPPQAARASRVTIAVSGLAVAALLAGFFPVAQMLFFGTTCYARSADAIVVFGARAYADGRPSDALSDRVLHACDLHRRGVAPLLIMSGGPGDGAVHECEAMRNLAVAQGVPPDAILLDFSGLNTSATVANAAAMLRERNLGSAIAVSHFYHLPRIRMLAMHDGLDLVTSPSPQRDGPLVRLPYFMARESAAFWFYWARAWTP